MIALLLTWWFSARITRPMEELAKARAKWRRDDGTRAANLQRREERTASDCVQRHDQTLTAQKESVCADRTRSCVARIGAAVGARAAQSAVSAADHGGKHAARAATGTTSSSSEIFTESTATLKAELANLNSIVGRFSDFSKMPAPKFARVNVNEHPARHAATLRPAI